MFWRFESSHSHQIVMYIYLIINEKTMKRTWNFGDEKCSACDYRFQCFTDASVTIKPSKIDESEIKDDRSKIAYQFRAEFRVPKCLRLGLLKQLNDRYWGGKFKFGEIKIDNGEEIYLTHIYVKFPDKLFVTGKRYLC